MKNKWLKRIGITVWILFTITMVLAYVGANEISQQYAKEGYPAPTIAGANLTQDPTLVADAKQLGIDYSPLNLTFTSKNISISDETVSGGAIGVFYPPNIIYIESGLSKYQELNIVAYEYMHYVWENLPTSTKQRISSELTLYRTQNSDYNADVSHYSGDTATIEDEQDSTACTRVEPYLLSDSFNAYCNAAIPNRSILF
jgi:hypothetical protein